MTPFKTPLALLFSLLLMTSISINLPAEAYSPQALEWHQKARLAIRENNLKDAEMALHQAITFDSFDPLLHISLGEVYQRQGLINQAIEAYTRASQLDSKDAGVYFTLGTLYEQKQDYDSAKYNYDIALQKNLQYSVVESRLAKLLGFQKKYPEAIAKYEAYLNQSPKDWEAHRLLSRFAIQLNTTEGGQKAIQHLLYMRQEAPSEFKDEALLAKAYLLVENPQNALKELSLAKANGRYSSEVANLQSVANEKLGNLSEAIEDLKIAAEANPTDVILQYRLAGLYAKQSQYGLALKHLEPFVQANPNDIKTQLVKIDWLNRQGSYVTAKATANQLLKKPNLKEAERLEAMTQEAFSALKSGDAKRAATLYQQVLSATPKEAEQYSLLQQNLGVALYESEQFPEALNVFQNVLNNSALNSTEIARVKQDVYHIYLKQGKQAGRAKQFEQAKNLLIEAKNYAQKGDELQDLRLELGALYLEHDYTQEAVALYEEALVQEPDNVEAALNLAKLWRETNPTRALDLVNRVLGMKELPESTRFQASYYKASALIHQNKKSEALVLLESLKATGKVDALDSEGWLDLGTLYHEKKQYPQAEEAYQKSLALDPQNTLTAYNLGSVYLAQQKYAPAKDAFLKAIQGETPFTQAFYGLGIAEEKTQNAPKAIEYFTEYLNRATDASADVKSKVQEKLNKLKGGIAAVAVPKMTPLKGDTTIVSPPNTNTPSSVTTTGIQVKPFNSTTPNPVSPKPATKPTNAQTPTSIRIPLNAN